jgi:uncharacterized CHY-type Zn-finger protein
VFDSHCGMRYICAECFHADFTSKRSMERHRASCKGKSALLADVVICAHCQKEWKNQADMNLHAPYCVYTGSPHA